MIPGRYVGRERPGERKVSSPYLSSGLVLDCMEVLVSLLYTKGLHQRFAPKAVLRECQ
jgi:hypothetical protein